MFKVQNPKPKSNMKLFLIATAEMLIFGGCAAQIQKPVRVCPGKESIAESLSSLRLQLENAVPLKANGQCLLQYYNGDRKPEKENFPVKLWVNPPVEIYMQGDVAFDPKGIVLGSNEEEFWLAIKLKEISGYWWGRWSEESYPEKLMISPRLVLEALGIAAVGDIESWSLSREGAFDVLTKQEGGAKTRKIYINNGSTGSPSDSASSLQARAKSRDCDYLVRRVEYFDDDGRATVVTELDKYKELIKGFFVPTFIKIINRTDSNKEDSVQITLSSVKPANFTDKQRKRLFIRPEPQGFKHIYKIVDGNIIEQPQ
jgi:hypothetical protein